MESADLNQELVCPVCLAIYTDPVILGCGHTTFRVCIARVLDTQEAAGRYSCPECGDVYKERPALQRNIALRNIAERFRSTQPDQEEAGVCCTYCVDSPVPAVMSCLMCDASLCDKHLGVHSKAPEHILCPPTANLESRKCSLHKEILKYYCTEDSTCVCVSCYVNEGHVGHQMVSLDEASEKKKKKLRDDLQKLLAEMEEAEERVQRMQEGIRNAQDKAADETERVTALFRDLRRRLQELEKRVLRDIDSWAERAAIGYDELTWRLEIKKEKLSRKMRHIEKLCSMADPLIVLQEAPTGDLCDIEEGDNEDRERHELHDGGDLDVAISHTLHTGLSDIMSGVIVQERPDTPAYPHNSAEDRVSITAVLSRPHPQSSPKRLCLQSTLTRPYPKSTLTVQCAEDQAGGRNIGAVQETSWQSVWADIILDVATAGDGLRISNDGKSASRSNKSSDRSERFWFNQVMSSQSFSSGQHYWEVDVGRSDRWRVGMCYPSIARRGSQSGIGNNNDSWCLERWGWDDPYSVRHGRKKIRLPAGIPIDRVRIDLDYDAGKISFYALGDSIRHLHTFTKIFIEPLLAAVWVGEGCIKISRGIQKVENSAH